MNLDSLRVSFRGLGQEGRNIRADSSPRDI